MLRTGGGKHELVQLGQLHIVCTKAREIIVLLLLALRVHFNGKHISLPFKGGKNGIVNSSQDRKEESSQDREIRNKEMVGVIKFRERMQNLEFRRKKKHSELISI